MHLSKVFDTINRELPVAKLYAYGFSTEALDTKHVAKSQDQCNFYFLRLSYFRYFCNPYSLDPYCLYNYNNISYTLKRIFKTLQTTQLCTFAVQT